MLMLALNSKITPQSGSISNWKTSNITRLQGNFVKINNLVIISGAWTGNATNLESIFIVPTGFIPSANVQGEGTIHTGSVFSYAEYTLFNIGEFRQAQIPGNVTGGSFSICYTV